MLGYETYADVSMETKMAGSVTNVRQTLNTMLKLGRFCFNLFIPKMFMVYHAKKSLIK